MDEHQLQEVYQMVDSISFSRAKKNINRDFADGLLMAELIQHYQPKIVSPHNYPAANAIGKKIQNWNTLALKVLKKLGIGLSKAQIQDIANAVPGAIEQVLYQILVKFQKPGEEGSLRENVRKMESIGGSYHREIENSFEQHEAVAAKKQPIHNKEANNKNVTQKQEFFFGGRQKKERNQQKVADIEEIEELLQRIQQTRLQLIKLNELNKVKQDVIRNMQKKLQKFIFT